jgi:peptidoglycan/xylan/chitin deacetylase (PgdA/CDA1 family)
MFGSKFADTTVFFILLLATLIAGYFYNGYHWIWIIIASISYIALLGAGSYFISMNFYIRSINQLPLIRVDLFQAKGNIIQQRGKNIVLSFDDGPHFKNTPILLDILKKYDIKATFFLIGKNAKDHASITKRIAVEGHQIGNHSYHHRNTFSIQKNKLIANEINISNNIIKEITGQKPIYFRPPFGVTNPRVAAAIQATGMTSVGWNVRSYDTVAKDEKKLLQSIIKKTRSGSIILLHEKCDITIKILPELIHQLRQKGYEFTTI